MLLHTKPPARHSAEKPRGAAARRALLSVLAVVLFASSAAAFAYHDLQNQVNRVDVTDLLDDTTRPTRAQEKASDDYAGQAVNILVLGSDSRAGANDVDGSSEEELVARSDTAMVMHLSADRSRIDVVSVPRDTLVDVPSCRTADGGSTDTSYDMFNQAFANGAGTGNDEKAIAAGVACTIKTIESLTDVHIDEYMVVDFQGLSTMIDALGGVGLYVDEAIDDPDYTGLVLDTGCQHLDGATALQYARARHGVGDGSDLQRITRQQNLMSAMLRAAQSKNLLTNANDLYAFARSALGSLTTSPGIGSLTTLAGLAQSIQSIGMSNVNFVTMPNAAPEWNLDRVVPTDAADEVWKALKEDKPVPSETVSVSADGAPPSTPAAEDTAEDGTSQDGSAVEPAAPAEAGSQTTFPSSQLPAEATTNPAEQCH